ncbi:hypothetical protein HK102_001501 [Quaeritorhiza haematococci]|nr:hypothetical protein HK102_001501 [Quaeritorhiza haematococci]
MPESTTGIAAETIPDYGGKPISPSPLTANVMGESAPQQVQQEPIPRVETVSGERRDVASRLSNQVSDLIYWKRPLASFAALAGSLLALFLTDTFSIVRLSSLLFMITILVDFVIANTGSFVWNLFSATTAQEETAGENQEPTGEGQQPSKPKRPRQLLNDIRENLLLRRETTMRLAENLTDLANAGISWVLSIIFIEDNTKSLLAALASYFMYLAAAFMSTPLMIATAIIMAFTVPKAFERYRAGVDKLWSMGKGVVNQIWDIGVSAKNQFWMSARRAEKSNGVQLQGVAGSSSAPAKEKKIE